MDRALPLAVLVLVAACAPIASSPSAPSATNASPAASATPATAPTVPASASPSSSATPIPLPTFTQLAAAGSGVVWAFVNGDHLFRSTDRGDTWAERALPQPKLPNARIAFVSAQDGWMLSVVSPATQCSGQAVTLWRTADGAATWTKLDPTGIDAAQCKDSIAFIDAQRGYIGAWDPNTQPRIYRTSDGGKTWSTSTLPNPPAQRVTTVGDFGSVVLAAAERSTSPGRSIAFRSTDGGATWSAVSTGPADGLIPIVFVSPTRWVQIILRDQSQETTDGGATWHAFNTNYEQAAPVAPQVVFGDASIGYATVRGSIQRTTDGGTRWTPIKTPGT